MMILGIDPGSRFTGWGLLRQTGNRSEYLDSGTLRLGSETSLSARLLKLTLGIEGLLEKYSPDQCAVEQIFTAKNARSALVLGHARGVILCAMARAGVVLHEYSATQVKQAITGVGRAPKEQVQLMVGALLNRQPTFQEDEADALAVALTHGVFSNIAGKLA